MKRVWPIILPLLMILLISCGGPPSCPPQGSASCDPQLPLVTTDTGWWIDLTGTVSPELIRALNEESKALNDEAGGFQLAGLIASNAISDPSKVASDFGNKSGIGSAEKDNGFVVLVLLDKKGTDGNAPYIFLAPGRGIDSYFTATRLGRFRDEIFVPARKEGKWEEGLTKLVQTLHSAYKDPAAYEYQDSTTAASNSWAFWLLVIFISVIVLVIVIGLISSSSSNGEYGGRRSGPSSSSGSSGSSSSGGGGGFGGSGSGG